MHEDSLRALRVARTRLTFERNQIDAALSAIAELLGGTGTGVGDVEATPAPFRPAAPRGRTEKTAATRTKAAAAPDTPKGGRAVKAPASSHLALVLDVLRKHPDGMRPKDIAAAAHLTGDETKVALAQLRHTRQVVASGATMNRTYRPMVKPNGKAADELEVVWSGSSKRPLTVQEPA